MRSRLVAALIAWVGTSAPAPAQGTAAELHGTTRYYFTLFAGESLPFRPRTAHTWGTYARVTQQAGGTLATEVVTISWLPADAHVQPLRLRSVPGRNWSLQETLAIMAGQNGQVSRWGPYEINEERFLLARKQAAFLESGAARYRALDSFNFNNEIVNCVHALTHASPAVKSSIQPVIRVGEPGTSRLAKLYFRAGAFLSYPRTHDWLLPLIGADQYPTSHREPGEYIPRRFR